jgi:hypothetical protein
MRFRSLCHGVGAQNVCECMTLCRKEPLPREETRKGGEPPAQFIQASDGCWGRALFYSSIKACGYHHIIQRQVLPGLCPHPHALCRRLALCRAGSRTRTRYAYTHTRTQPHSAVPLPCVVRVHMQKRLWEHKTKLKTKLNRASLKAGGGPSPQEGSKCTHDVGFLHVSAHHSIRIAKSSFPKNMLNTVL